jgi:hypothetical protein
MQTPSEWTMPQPMLPPSPMPQSPMPPSPMLPLVLVHAPLPLLMPP